MTCTQAHDLILLNSSGELSADERIALKEHLATCRECRVYAAASERIMSVAATHLATGGPSEAVLDRVKSTGYPERVLRFPLPARWAAAAAAVLLVAAGIRFTFNQESTMTPHSGLSSLVAMMHDSPDPSTADGNGSSLHALAEELLRMEGLWVEEDDDLFFSLEEETPPTDPLSGSSPGLPAGKCA